MEHRNRYFEGTEDGQMTPRVYPNLIPTLKIYVFWYSRWTDGRTDRRMETLIRNGLCNLSVPPG
jgi:hypothetical protein